MKKKVLLVDDSAELLIILRAFLSINFEITVIRLII